MLLESKCVTCDYCCTCTCCCGEDQILQGRVFHYLTLPNVEGRRIPCSDYDWLLKVKFAGWDFEARRQTRTLNYRKTTSSSVRSSRKRLARGKQNPMKVDKRRKCDGEPHKQCKNRRPIKSEVSTLPSRTLWLRNHMQYGTTDRVMNVTWHAQHTPCDITAPRLSKIWLYVNYYYCCNYYCCNYW